MEDIPAEKVRSIYRLRWQIELVFKGWKSHEGLGKVKKVKRERTLMELYAKLIWIVVKTRIEVALASWGRKNNHPMSIQKIQDELSIDNVTIWENCEPIFNILLDGVEFYADLLKLERRKRYDGEEHDCIVTLNYLANCRINNK